MAEPDEKTLAGSGAGRKRRGLRQLDAAREIGVCRETVARIEVDHIPSQATRAKVCRWLAAAEAAAAERAAARRAAVRSAAADRVADSGDRPEAWRRRGFSRRRVLTALAIRRQAERAHRAAAAARAEQEKTRKDRKGQKGSRKTRAGSRTRRGSAADERGGRDDGRTAG